MYINYNYKIEKYISLTYNLIYLILYLKNINLLVMLIFSI